MSDPAYSSTNPLTRRIWRKLRGEASWIQRFGTFRERERFGLIDRPNYAYGMLRAADTAAYFGKKAVTVCEFGVASGGGLLNLASLSRVIRAETGITFDVVGFDTGKGLLPPAGHKDHPELWNGGDFPMGNVDELQRKLGDDARLVIGDIGDTIDSFRESLSPDAPLGFVSIDVDVYSGTASAFRVLTGNSESYLPAISFYFDDVTSYFSNFACGELCAIAEHNESHRMRPIDVDRSLPKARPDRTAGWYQSMYVCHILDHPLRQASMPRHSLNLLEHLHHMGPLQ
jgi:hypothetical protein